MPTPISDTEPGWTCDYCGEEFDDRNKAEDHENICEEEWEIE